MSPIRYGVVSVVLPRQLHEPMPRSTPLFPAAPGASAEFSSHSGQTGRVNREEACRVLGLSIDADDAAIREAHRRRIRETHPDAGGSARDAARVNEALAALRAREANPPSSTDVDQFFVIDVPPGDLLARLAEAGDAVGEVVFVDPTGGLLEIVVGDAPAVGQLAVTVGEARPDGTPVSFTLEPAHVVMNRADHTALGLGARERIPGASVTVVTNGPRPSLVMVGDSVRPVEVPPVDDIIDRTGVGDGFLAGFLASRRNAADPVSAAHAGHRAAAKVLRQLGPTTESRS